MTTCRCGTTYTGHRVEHCTGCHQTFTATAPGDMHRVGRHDVTEGPRASPLPHPRRNAGQGNEPEPVWLLDDAEQPG
jgi:hypothetical protein